SHYPHTRCLAPPLTLLSFFSDHTPPPEISTLSLHDALPICARHRWRPLLAGTVLTAVGVMLRGSVWGLLITLPGLWFLVCTLLRSEEHTSELQSLTNLVCRLLLEKKKKYNTDVSDITYRLQY